MDLWLWYSPKDELSLKVLLQKRFFKKQAKKKNAEETES